MTIHLFKKLHIEFKKISAMTYFKFLWVMSSKYLTGCLSEGGFYEKDTLRYLARNPEISLRSYLFRQLIIYAFMDKSNISQFD